jgi:murein DD-endopeptidase MepM/ murein hydrolase activator NlpD
MMNLKLPSNWTRALPLIAAAPALALMSLPLSDARAEGEDGSELTILAPMYAAGLRLDTLLLGGYTQGPFQDAVSVLARDLTREEQVMVGSHLEKVFSSAADSSGMGRTGRLRLAYERAVRRDGTTRSVRVLAAELAMSGQLHTAFYFERDGKPGYYDPFGRSLDPGAWADPLENPRVSSPFGTRRMHPILGRVLPHNGVDYAARSGTPVRATGDGVISVAGRRGGYGTMIEIQHPSGFSSRYAHLSSITPGLGTGSLVRQGDEVGRVGMSGLATGPHLHYEVRRRGRAMDPTHLAEIAPEEDLGAQAGWASARARLSELLAGAPTTVTVR